MRRGNQYKNRSGNMKFTKKIFASVLSLALSANAFILPLPIAQAAP